MREKSADVSEATDDVDDVSRRDLWVFLAGRIFLEFVKEEMLVEVEEEEPKPESE